MLTGIVLAWIEHLIVSVTQVSVKLLCPFRHGPNGKQAELPSRSCQRASCDANGSLWVQALRFAPDDSCKWLKGTARAFNALAIVMVLGVENMA